MTFAPKVPVRSAYRRICDGHDRFGARCFRRRLVLGPALVPQSYPTDQGESAVELVVDPARMHEVFAADLATDTAAVLAATQRPIAAAAFDEMSGPPSWRLVKSWAVVATSDKAAGTDIVREMAQRAGAKITEVDSSHVVMVSHPEVVTDVILDAARASELAAAS